MRAPFLSPAKTMLRGALVATVAMIAQPCLAATEALLLVDAGSGKVLYAENAARPWHPASLTKLMTAYVTLHALKEGRVTPDTLFTVSPTATAQSPSKMGFKVGIRVTVDNALKMTIVKSANDMAVVLAEGISGSIPSFAAEMNRAAQRLGMTQTNFVNPNGLPDDEQVTSARDLAILTRALIREFPDYDLYWHISALKFGRRIIRNHNPLIDRYPGADGMKTGFICASGFNLVATVTRGDQRLIGIVLGAPNSAVRTEKVLGLFERGFNGSGNALSWLTSLGTVDALQPVSMPPPDLHEEVCGKNRHRGETAEEEPPPTADPDRNVALGALLPPFASGGKPAIPVLGPPVPSMAPMVVFVGPPKTPGNPDTAIAKSEPRPAHKPKPKAAKPALAAAKPMTPASAPPAAHRKKPAPAASTEKPAAAAAPAGH
jgi:D-alanyl-D-alanine carboxypeptidase